MNASTDLPLFLTPGGEAIIERNRKELTVFLNLLNKDTGSFIRNHVGIIINPWSLDANEVGEKAAENNKNWWVENNKTCFDFTQWLFSGKHRINGKSWCNGNMGSRWADIDCNGKRCRVAFYNKEKIQKMGFDGIDKTHNYLLMVEPMFDLK
jgi:hypothetical protein